MFEKGFLVRIGTVISVYLVYIVSFPFLYPVMGEPLGAFSFVPIVLVGLLFGRIPGIIAGLAITPLSWVTYGIQNGDIIEGLLEPVQIVVIGSSVLLGGLAGTMSDMATSLKQHKAALGESNERFELATRTTGDIIWERDMTTQKTWTNQAFSELVRGVPEASGDSDAAFFDALHPHDRDRVAASFAGIADTNGAQFEDSFRLRRADGQYRDMEANAVLVRDETGKVVRAVGSTRDVTDRNAAERARRMELLHKMELDRAQEMDQFKTQLMNTASHELNTPISALKMQLHLLRLQFKRGDSAAVEQGLALLERNTDRLAALVLDTLDVARIQSGKLALQPVDVELEDVLRDVVATFQPMAEEDGLELVSVVPEHMWVHADPKRLTQVMTNLVGNAIKFTPPNGKVRISAHADGRHVVVDVKDTGMGMTREQIERLFQPFVRVHDENVVKKGTGLGLYISQAIMAESGGRIWAESQGPGRGTVFHVRIPAAADQGGPGNAARTASTNASGSATLFR